MRDGVVKMAQLKQNHHRHEPRYNEVQCISLRRTAKPLKLQSSKTFWNAVNCVEAHSCSGSVWAVPLQYCVSNVCAVIWSSSDNRKMFFSFLSLRFLFVLPSSSIMRWPCLDLMSCNATVLCFIRHMVVQISIPYPTARLWEWRWRSTVLWFSLSTTNLIQRE